MKVTEHQSGDTFQVVERGADDTSGLSFVTDDKVQMRFPKIILEAYRDDIVTNVAGIATNLASITVLDTYFAGTANPTTLPAPSGLKMFFYEDTAPATWTIDAGPADSLLAVKGGAQDYNVAGQQVVGSWTPTTHTHTGPSHTHNGPSHTHTMGTHIHTMPTHYHTMPSHTHTVDVFAGTGTGTVLTNTLTQNVFADSQGEAAWRSVGGSSASQVAKRETTSSKDPGDTNAKDPGDTNATDPGDTNASGTGATNASGTAATGASSQPSTDRPQAAVGIIATKD